MYTMFNKAKKDDLAAKVATVTAITAMTTMSGIIEPPEGYIACRDIPGCMW